MWEDKSEKNNSSLKTKTSINKETAVAKNTKALNQRQTVPQKQRKQNVREAPLPRWTARTAWTLSFVQGWGQCDRETPSPSMAASLEDHVAQRTKTRWRSPLLLTVWWRVGRKEKQHSKGPSRFTELPLHPPKNNQREIGTEVKPWRALFLSSLADGWARQCKAWSGGRAREEHRGVHKEMQGWGRHGKANQRRHKPCKRRPGRKAVDRSREGGWICKVEPGKSAAGLTRQSKWEVHPRIAPRPKLPGQTGLALISSGLPLICTWNTGAMCFTSYGVILVHELMAEIFIPPPKWNTSKNCSQVKAPGTDASGWPWPPLGCFSSTPETS